MHSGAILTIEDVSKSFDGFKAIDDLTFYLFNGELRTIIGPNGAGKSTFFDLITGRTRPDTGKLIYETETDLTQLNEFQINRIGIGRKFQTPSVFTAHTVWDNLVLSTKGSRGVFASVFHRLTPAECNRLDEILDLIHLTEQRDRPAGLLSHGQKQWLEIGMLLAQSPRVLLVDEPAAGMTDEETHRTGELLLSLAGDHSLIVVEHDMSFVKQISQGRNVTVLHQGSILCEGKFETVQDDPKVREVYLGRGKEQTA